MSFCKRNVVISQKVDSPVASPKQAIPGVRPSPVTGHATTSAGTESLDKLLGLGAGLALGTSLMIEEEGTTEFSRSLLSCYAAEGVLQGHTVFVVGPEGSLTLPGLVEGDGKKSVEKTSVESERMKIAWRYERLGAFEDRERGGSTVLHTHLCKAIPFLSFYVLLFIFIYLFCLLAVSRSSTSKIA
jgi:elongator complex protein 4